MADEVKQAFQLGHLALQAKMTACLELDISLHSHIMELNSEFDAAHLYSQHEHYQIMDVLVIYVAADVGTQSRKAFDKRLGEHFPFLWSDNEFRSKVYQSYHKAIRLKGISTWKYKNRGHRNGRRGRWGPSPNRW